MRISTTWFIAASAAATAYAAKQGETTAAVICGLLTLTACGISATARYVERRKP